MFVSAPSQRRSDRLTVVHRLRTARRRTVRVGAVLLAAASLAGAAGCASSTTRPVASISHTAARSSVASHSSAASHRPVVTKVSATLLPWRVPAVSREVAVGVGSTQLAVIGGLRAGGTSSGEVDVVDLASGASHRVAALPLPVHDAAAGVLAEQTIVLGGGAPVTLPGVQAMKTPVPGASIQPRVIGRLPHPRSDATAVTLGGRLFVVGGYDGNAAAPEVLATSNGRSFAAIVNLPVPVRYPAVTVLGNVIYVIGGQATGGSHAGQATDTIQAIDPASGSARVVAHLAHPLTAACAVTVAGDIYLLGGRQSAALSATASGAVDRLDPRTGRLRQVARLPVPTSNAAAVVLDHSVWLVGGERVSTPLPFVQRITMSN